MIVIKRLTFLSSLLFIFSINIISQEKNLINNQKTSKEEIKFEQFMEETQESLNNLINMITLLQKNIEKRLNEFENEMQNNSDEIRSIDERTNNQIDDLLNSNRTLNKEINDLKQSHQNIQSNLNKYSEDINNEFKLLNGNITHLENSIQKMDKETSRELVTIRKDIIAKFLTTGGIGILSILFIIGLAFYFKRKLKKNNLLEKSIKLDTKMSQLLENQMELIKKEQENESQKETKIDHSIPISAGTEIFRMRKRIKHMDESTKGIHALKNALDRVEFKLNQNGYHIKDLSGEYYYDEMTVKIINSITRDNIEPGKPIISRMISPQIFYKDKAVSLGEAEVAISPKDK